MVPGIRVPKEEMVELKNFAYRQYKERNKS